MHRWLALPSHVLRPQTFHSPCDHFLSKQLNQNFKTPDFNFQILITSSVTKFFQFIFHAFVRPVSDRPGQGGSDSSIPHVTSTGARGQTPCPCSAAEDAKSDFLCFHLSPLGEIHQLHACVPGERRGLHAPNDLDRIHETQGAFLGQDPDPRRSWALPGASDVVPWEEAAPGTASVPAATPACPPGAVLCLLGAPLPLPSSFRVYYSSLFCWYRGLAGGFGLSVSLPL